MCVYDIYNKQLITMAHKQKHNIIGTDHEVSGTPGDVVTVNGTGDGLIFETPPPNSPFEEASLGGNNAKLIGTTNNISGSYSIVGGDMNSGNGNNAIISGSNNNSDGNDGLVVGDSNTNYGNKNIIGGSNNQINGENHTVGGVNNQTNGDKNIINGENNTLNASESIIAGNFNTIGGDYSMIVGSGNQTVDTASYIFGGGNIANAAFTFIQGDNNESYEQYNAIFGIGNKALSGGHNVITGIEAENTYSESFVHSAGILPSSGNKTLHVISAIKGEGTGMVNIVNAGSSVGFDINALGDAICHFIVTVAGFEPSTGKAVFINSRGVYSNISGIVSLQGALTDQIGGDATLAANLINGITVDPAGRLNIEMEINGSPNQIIWSGNVDINQITF